MEHSANSSFRRFVPICKFCTHAKEMPYLKQCGDAEQGETDGGTTFDNPLYAFYSQMLRGIMTSWRSTFSQRDLEFQVSSSTLIMQLTCASC